MKLEIKKWNVKIKKKKWYENLKSKKNIKFCKKINEKILNQKSLINILLLKLN